jgi:hypothetical protein
MTFSRPTLSIKGLFVTLSTIVAYLIYCYAECHYAECHYAEGHYAECRYAEGHYASVVMLSLC